MVKHVVKGPCSSDLRGRGSAKTPVFARGCGISEFSGWAGVLHAPKPGAIPTSLYPDIHFSAMIPRRGVKIKFFLSVVIPVVKAAFVPFSATGGKPAIARAARLCGLLSKPRMDRVYALPNQARYQLRYTRRCSPILSCSAGKSNRPRAENLCAA